MADDEDVTGEAARCQQLWNYIDKLNEMIIKKDNVLIDVWSHLNEVDNKSEAEKVIYEKVLAAIEIGHDHDNINKTVTVYKTK